MIELPESLPRDVVRALDPDRTVVWATARGLAWLREIRDDLPVAPLGAEVPSGTSTLVAIGGGALLDEAKVALGPARGSTRLIAVPTIWGSGAEASPVAVVDRAGTKEIHLDDALRPDAMIHDAAFAGSVTSARARHACGDVWAHALEGFASPLASTELRTDLGALISEMLVVPLDADARWFALGARACAGQARAGVGLVHGMAHVLEIDLASPAWGHARLCATLLRPVLAFDLTSDKWSRLFAAHDLDATAIERVAAQLFEPKAWTDEVLPAVRHAWPRIVRDPLTRTNATVVRPSSLSFFEEFVP